MRTLTAEEIRKRNLPVEVPGREELLGDFKERNSYTELDREDTLRYAEKNGLDIVVPDNDELQIDIDSEEAYHTFNLHWEQMGTFSTLTTMRIIYNEPSKSGLPRRHIIIKLPRPLGAGLRIALQLWLGSDPVREKNNIRRVLNQDIFPIALFEKRKES